MRGCATITMRIIAGQSHGRRLRAPRGLATRPATARVRQSIFSRLQARMNLDGSRVLDLYAGSGSLGIEALSRGATSVVFVDKSRDALETIRGNLATLDLKENAEIVNADAIRVLEMMAARGEQFDLVFVDPPYANDNSAAILERADSLGVLAPGGWMVVRQAGRAARINLAESAGLDEVSVATLGDHRIALYRRPASALES